MVRRNVFIAGMILILGSVAVTASAQPGGPGGGMGGMLGGLFGGPVGQTASNVMLLGIPEVQTELNITPGQKTKVTALLDESRQKMRESFGQINFRDLMNATPEEQKKFRDDMQKKMADASKGVDDKVNAILDATQSKRLHELVLQRLGAAALVLPDTVKALKLNTDQVTKINGIISAAASGFPRPTFDPDQSQEERQKAMQDMRKKIQDQVAKTQKDCLAVLTDDQMLDWTNLCGKTFKFPENAGFGRGMRGGGPAPGQ
jgi:Spy/CpxP family protein refolding chaperone